ncbi:MAG: hypothetical protein LBM23_07745 [Propionibacteriaceae bacterium]|jgi:hypothetical protein|nr:hypothetical protein [Propionibacteriaceae bacterium]
MRLYAQTGSLRFLQFLSDVGLIAWCYAWYWIAGKVYNAIQMFAVPAEKTAETASTLSTSLGNAAENVGGVPMVGDAIRTPFDGLASGIGSITAYSQQLIDMIAVAALVLAGIVLIVPVIFYLSKWLPWRLRFIAQSGHAKALMAADDSPKLFALRAIAHAPLKDLQKISADPIKAWMDDDPAVVTQLAALELGRDGLKMPKDKAAAGATKKEKKAKAKDSADEAELR